MHITPPSCTNRYYYAVVEFDTPSAAQHAYQEIDSTEFEATANVFDLRWVPRSRGDS